MNKGTKKKFY